MDGLSAAASVIAVIQIVQQVFTICQTYYSEVKDARKDIQLLRDEVTSLQDVLTNVKELSDSPSAAELSSLKLLNQPNGPLERCQAELEKLFVKLEAGANPSDGKMKQFGLRALKWPFSSKDVQKIITHIEKSKTLFNLALSSDQITLELAINQGIDELKEQSADTRNEIATLREDGDRDKIIGWLSATDPSSNHHAACKKHQPATGEWLFKRSEFEHWKRTQNSQLWLYGNAGSGKTILSSTIIRHLEKYCNSSPRLAHAYFYFDFNDTQKQNATNFLSSVLCQLCCKVLDLPLKIKEIYLRFTNGSFKATVHDLVGAISGFARTEQLDDIFIVADALDECPTFKGEREEVLDVIRDLVALSPSNIHLIVTSRPELDIKEKLSTLPTLSSLSIQNSDAKVDIKTYIANCLAKDSKLKGWSNDVKVLIEDRLANGAKGMFRWVACQLDALKKCRRKRDVLKTLDELPESLDETYERILLNIDKKDQPEAQRALTWLAFSVRPLNVGELAEAVVIDPQSATPFDPEERLHDPYHDVLEILGSLITISEFAPESESESESESELSFEFGLDSKSRENTEGGPDDGNEFEKLSRYVRLAHFSVKEYLLSARIMDSRASKFGINAVESNKFIAECCLLYFFHYDEWDPVEDFNGTTELLPLLPYAGERWPTHAEAIPQDAQSQLEPLVFKLFLSETAFVKWMRVFHDMEPETCSTWEPLFQASHMGLVSVVQLLLDKGADPNARDFEGATALYRAVFTGEVEVVRLLLKNGADANIEDNNSWTALQRAVMNGNLAMVCALLESGADIESRYEGQWTILHEAVEKGHTNIAKLLIEKGADIKAKDNDGWTALQRAVMKGNQTIVCALLERGADIESRYEGKWTLLHYAIWGGDTNIAKLLIEKGADVEAAGNGGWTVLHTAAQGGYKDLVRLLLEMGADIKTEYNGGWTALHTAARDGYKDVVQLLLETGADVEAKDNGGWTALHAAAQDGCEDLVEFLLENGADVHAETETEPYAGWTALHIAGYRGHDAAVQVLIEKGADPLAKTELGETVLDVAISNNSKGVVDLLSSYANQSGSRPQPRTKLQQDGSRVHQIVYE